MIPHENSGLRLVKIHKDGHRIYEHKPMVRTIYTNLGKYTLSLPYVQIIFKKWKGWKNYWSFHVSFSNSPIKGTTSKVYFAALPNIYPQHQACLNYPKLMPYRTDMEVISNFWLSTFSVSPGFPYWEILDSLPMGTIEGWAKMTKEDPSFILDIEWEQETTIARILKGRRREDYTCFSLKEQHEP